jgi:hypothetical protein
MLFAGSQAFAAILNCHYINPANALVSGRMTAALTDEDAQRAVPAKSTYPFWSKEDDISLPSNKYADYPATITALLMDPKKALLFILENSQASETVEMKWDAFNKQYIGRRHIQWVAKERLDDAYSSIAICKVN